MNDTMQFIEDFKKSSIYTAILNDPKAEPIMIWVAGSVWLGMSDTNSDYDICILVKELPEEDEKSSWSIYSRPCSYFLWYKAQNKKADIIYTPVNDLLIASESTPLTHIGWAQIKYWPEEAIIYKNPKYLNFINKLFSKKEDIFKNSLYLFVKSLVLSAPMSDLDLLVFEKPDKPNKLLAHICWAAELLQGKEINISNILTIKRNLYNQLSQELHNYISDALKYIKTYLEQVKASDFINLDLLKYFEDPIMSTYNT